MAANRPLTFADLPADVVNAIGKIRYDSIGEKHEGPWDWAGVLKYSNPEIMQIDGQNVLLPLDREAHSAITVLRSLISADSQTMTIFLKDMSYAGDPKDAFFFAGYIAFCERLPDTDLFIATVYHNWFMVPPIREQLERPPRR